jgi:hypothetical protein
MESDNQIISVPSKIFAEFWKELENQKVSREVIAGLKKALVEEQQYSTETLKEALFSNDSQGL